MGDRRELARERMREMFAPVVGAFGSAKISHPDASIRLAVAAYSRGRPGSRNFACFQAASFLSDLLALIGDERLEEEYGEDLRKAAAEDAEAGET
jgi:hypothetical protein